MRSLLGPPGAGGDGAWADDLVVEPLARALALSGRHVAATRRVLTGLCADPAQIGRRQDLLADLLGLPDLCARLEDLLPALGSAAATGSGHWAEEAGIFQVAGRLAELSAYVGAVRSLLAALGAARPQLRAAGWAELIGDLEATVSSAEFRALEAELPALREQIERCGSVTLGINLDERLHPAGATLLSINAGRFGGRQSLLGRLLGGRGGQAGITPLRQAGERQAFGPDRQLFLDLSQLLEEVTAPIAAALTRYGRVSGAPLAELEAELAFVLGAARLLRALRDEGYPLCRPTIAAPEERTLIIDGLYNLELALRLRARPAADGVPAAPVPNDSRFDDSGRIFILTGPNRGGKTTFTRAVGLAVAMAQAGLLVPATAARISPADAIFSHFPAAEHAETGMGRLDEEAAQLAAIFRRASPQSLVLINEPLGSTSPREALAIARDVVCGLRILGARAILVTHLHDLAFAAERLNAEVDGPSRVATLAAGAERDPHDGEEHASRTYRISPGLPDGRSYAADIALAHGLRLSQIRSTLRERGRA